MKQVELRGKKGAPGRGAANARTDANRDEWRMWPWQQSTKGASASDERAWAGGPDQDPSGHPQENEPGLQDGGESPEGPEILLRLLWLQFLKQVAGSKRRGRRARRGPMQPPRDRAVYRRGGTPGNAAGAQGSGRRQTREPGAHRWGLEQGEHVQSP